MIARVLHEIPPVDLFFISTLLFFFFFSLYNDSIHIFIYKINNFDMMHFMILQFVIQPNLILRINPLLSMLNKPEYAIVYLLIY